MAPDKKQKGRNKKITLVQGSKKDDKATTNGATNGTAEMTEEGKIGRSVSRVQG